ncbi:SigE family RNA polymerase sigma factor [Actinospongicola halichondriae]|uniref:SigE family RNA polymerase sigma factor n=1 Tax=Actinospongicola halichondriae TaxID=3236844 RepID=UPI003D3FD2CF
MTVPEIEIVGTPEAETRPDFAAFFRAEYPGLVALATAVTGDRHAGEDIASEAMSRAYRRWARIASYDKPGAWTRRVAVNLLHSRRRRLGSEVRALLRVGNGDAVDADGADRVVGADNFDALLAPLAPRQRTATALHYLADLSVAEIADAMGCAEGTVKSHLHAARTAMSEALEGNEAP